jgi:hypothetical protein
VRAASVSSKVVLASLVYFLAEKLS